MPVKYIPSKTAINNTAWVSPSSRRLTYLYLFSNSFCFSSFVFVLFAFLMTGVFSFDVLDNYDPESIYFSDVLVDSVGLVSVSDFLGYFSVLVFDDESVFVVVVDLSLDDGDAGYVSVSLVDESVDLASDVVEIDPESESAVESVLSVEAGAGSVVAGYFVVSSVFVSSNNLY